jgi:predicted RNA binding protein YcfA (HicA-like mRNA interferase family)
MTRLHRVSGRECLAALKKRGFYFKRQHGSHINLRRDEPLALDHDELDRGTSRAILGQAGVAVGELVQLL